VTQTKTTRYQLLSEQLLDEIEGTPRSSQEEWLFLSESDEFKGRWEVGALWPDWFFDFEEIVGHYRTVSPAKLEKFLSFAAEGGYKVVFTDPPEDVLEAYARLRDPPPFSLNSTLDNTIHGMFPWQIEGFNKLVRDESINAGLVVWDTGTGKTGFIAAALKWHQEHGHPYDLAFVVVKKNNKIDTQRKIKALSDSDSFVIEGTPKKRDRVYEEVSEALDDKRKPIIITNYEGFRQDDEMFKWMMEDRDCLAFWDEMPTRLSNRTTQVYETVQKCLWRTFQPRKGLPTPRPKWLRQWELSATPIENSPEGLFNCVRLLDPLLLGSVTQFDADYVINRNPVSHKPERWGRLDRLEGKIEFMTHRASLADPEIAKLFPEIVEDPLLIDWDPRDRAVYDMLASNAVKILEEESESEEFNVLALIQVMQMICDAPSMIAQSAENHKEFQKVLSEVEDEDEMPRMVKGSEIAVRLVETLKRLPTDDRHTKFETLREILTEKHPDDKALIYMTWASYGFEPVCRKLDEWGVTYVSYTGTDKQRQAAKDQFRADSDIQVFLSSDKGSDSIDLPEAAVGINYNLPWTWTRKRQRQGRNNRVDSELDTTWWYDLIMANSVEERKQEIIYQKRGFHEMLFDGKAAENSISSKMTRDDLIQILKGP
jgi:SNF2 family DNA or RNA helicase